MSQSITVFQFEEQHSPIRAIQIEGEPWFIANDVCALLELQNSRQSVSALDDDEKLTYGVAVFAKIININIIALFPSIIILIFFILLLNKRK